MMNFYSVSSASVNDRSVNFGFGDFLQRPLEGWGRQRLIESNLFRMKIKFCFDRKLKTRNNKKASNLKFCGSLIRSTFFKDFFWEQIDWFFYIFKAKVDVADFIWSWLKKLILLISHSHFFFMWQCYLGAANFIPITLLTWTSLFLAGGSLGPLKVTKTGRFGASLLVIG